jgi:crotonobetainyl-CoA:carnitine CoA-transferase CaiB-like acyl-CoA transferase
VTAGAICGGALAQAGRAGAPGPDVELGDEERAWWSERLSRCNESNPDVNAAVVTAAAVTMALQARARTGAGQAVETRMMGANAYALSEHFIEYPGRPPRALPDAELYGIHARYRLYRARDGWIFLAATDDRSFSRLCHALDRTLPVEDHRLAQELEAAFRERPVDAWVRELTAAGVACVRAHDGTHADYVFGAPWAERLGFVEDASATGSGPYPRYSRVVRTTRDVGPLGAADAAGAQTRDILVELGYDDNQVAAMLSHGIVSTPT